MMYSSLTRLGMEGVVQLPVDSDTVEGKIVATLIWI